MEMKYMVVRKHCWSQEGDMDRKEKLSQESSVDKGSLKICSLVIIANMKTLTELIILKYDNK